MGADHSVEAPRGDINIVIKASKDSHEATVDAQGVIVTPITSPDCNMFNITYEMLCNTVIELHKSKSQLIRDTHSLVSTYVSRPTPLSSHMYETNKWKEVKRVLKPARADVVKVNSVPVIIANHKFTNQSSKTVSYNASLTHEEQNTVTSKWSTTKEFSIGLKIDHKVIMPGSCEISFNSSWGEDTEQSKAITIGVQSGMTVDLGPGEVVLANLRVNRCSMEVRITYDVSMEGDVGCIFKDYWRWHYVKFDIKDVLQAANVPTTVTYSEVLIVDFSTDGEILISDG